MNTINVKNVQPAAPEFYQPVAVQDITEDLGSRFLAFLDVRPKTVQTYTRSLRQFFGWLQEHGIRTPQRDDIIAYRDSLKESHSPATVQSYIIAVRLFFQWTEQEHIYPNVAAHVKGAKIDAGHKKDYLTAAQVRKILEGVERDTLQGKRDYAILTLMLTAGLRTVEVIRADVRDLTVNAGHTVLYVQGKGHDQKTDYVKVPEQTESAIRDYLAARDGYTGADPLFGSCSNRDGGERMTTRSVSRIVKTRMQAAGYDSDRLTAHSLRHTAATLNLLNGGSLVETQQLLRHSNVNTTLIYSHALDREKNNSESRVADAIFGK